MKKLNIDVLVTWVVIGAIAILVAREFLSHFTHPKTDWIYYEDVEIGKYDSIRDKRNISKVGDTLVIREHSQGRGKAYIWGKYKGYNPQGGPVQIGDSIYYVYYNKAVRVK